MGLVDLYMRDADMICVIAMTDVGHERPRRDSQSQQGVKWGSCTVGQCIIVLEFIYAIKRLASSGDNYEIEVGKMFLIDLERKLGMYLVSKVSLCKIFKENRYTLQNLWLVDVTEFFSNKNSFQTLGEENSRP